MCKSKVLKIKGRMVIAQVCCEECGRWELFENAGMGEVYDEQVVNAASFRCRMCELRVEQNDVRQQ